MEMDYSLYSEVYRKTRREMEKKHERMMEEMEHEKAIVEALGLADLMMQENEELKENVRSLENELEQLQLQLAEEKKQRAELEMKIAEMSKLSADVAKKATEENLLKGLRIYANRSKRKTPDKRTFAKSAILEIANANGLVLPEDLSAIIESLDDEQNEPARQVIIGTLNGSATGAVTQNLGEKSLEQTV